MLDAMTNQYAKNAALSIPRIQVDDNIVPFLSTTDIHISPLALKKQIDLMTAQYRIEHSENPIFPDLHSASARTKVVSWLPDVENILLGFLNFDANWNGRGAQRVSDLSVSEANSILSIAADGRAPKPFVSPSSEGGIFFRFQSGDRTLSVLIENSVAYANYSSGENSSEFGGDLLGEAAELFMDQFAHVIENYLVDADGEMAA